MSPSKLPAGMLSRKLPAVDRCAALEGSFVALAVALLIGLGCRQGSRVAGAGSTPNGDSQEAKKRIEQPAEKGSAQVSEKGNGPAPGDSNAMAGEAGAMTLEKAGIRAHVFIPEGEAKSIGTYLVHIALPGGTQEIREQRNGVISGAWLQDLDGDGEVDLTVFMTSAGSGSYATIDFYRQERQNFVLHPLKDLSDAQRAGYMGHDSVEVKDGDLMRTFPRYLPNDLNSTPSGGTVTLRYSFTDDGWVSP
jgi:PliI/PliC-like inhibitor of I-type lysozyme